ncbi:MAG: hypothetical protein EBU82_04435 [Flavobacteriia bacterium]|nr:hypothetical protein [Flavobacteriia bacterium]
MVFLNDLINQWPWNANQEDLSDKEIYTHRVAIEDASDVWRVPVLDPMRGFAFTGMRVSVYGKDTHYTMVPKLVLGATKKSMFGLPWDQTTLNNGVWTPIGFPITNKIVAICEDGLDYIIQHSQPCWGKVEFVAQRFNDLQEDESEITYMFLNHRTDKVEWVLNSDNRMYKPRAWDAPVYRSKTKLMPSVLRLLDKDRIVWQDTALFWNEVNLPAPLLVGNENLNGNAAQGQA